VGSLVFLHIRAFEVFFCRGWARHRPDYSFFFVALKLPNFCKLKAAGATLHFVSVVCL
jgi:hypothetical protein